MDLHPQDDNAKIVINCKLNISLNLSIVLNLSRELLMSEQQNISSLNCLALYSSLTAVLER